ncbi:hypothetical protein [Brevibacillus gelatini]
MINSQKVQERMSFLETLGLNNGFEGQLVSIDDLVEWTRLTGLASTYLAGVAVLSPVFEVKNGVALALFEVVDAYVAMVNRLQELHTKVPPRPAQDPVAVPNARWLTPKEIVEQLLEPVLAGINNVLANTNRIAEWPTVRVLERVCKPSLTAAIGIIDRIYKQKLNANVLARMGERDDRYTTFNHTRDYEDDTIEPKVESNAIRNALIAQLRTQRDELDAVETFARLLAAESEIRPAMLLELARVVSDEARHSLIGEIGLEKLGFNPFNVPIGTIGAELRSSLQPWEGLAQICLVGEAGNLQKIDQGSIDARDLNEKVIAESLRMIYFDERYHIEFGTRLLLERNPEKTPKGFQNEALSLTNKFLQNRGLPVVNMANVGRILGE